MFLPTTYVAVLWLLILSAFCYGSWATTQKLTGKWRFEMFCYDYAFGVALCAVVAAFTLGSMLPKELTFQDNLLIASKRQIGYGALGGVVLNLGNILLLAAISVSGLTIAFPVSMATAILIGVVFKLVDNPKDSPLPLFAGAFLVVVSIILAALAHGLYVDSRIDRTVKPKARRPSAARGIFLSVMSGIFLGLGAPLVEMSREGEAGVSPYGAALLLAGGVLVSTLLYVPFFMTFPPQGPPIGVREYFKGGKREHWLGVLGGVMWLAGAIASFAAGSAPFAMQLGPGVNYALIQGAALIAVLWGWLAWRELSGSSLRVHLLVTSMIVLYAVGVGLISVAQTPAR